MPAMGTVFEEMGAGDPAGPCLGELEVAIVPSVLWCRSGER